MLTPRLAAIKSRIEAQRSPSREEQELLEELRDLDANTSDRILLEKYGKRGKIVSGPTTRCECCGR